MIFCAGACQRKTDGKNFQLFKTFTIDANSVPKIYAVLKLDKVVKLVRYNSTCYFLKIVCNWLKKKKNPKYIINITEIYQVLFLFCYMFCQYTKNT